LDAAMTVQNQPRETTEARPAVFTIDGMSALFPDHSQSSDQANQQLLFDTGTAAGSSSEDTHVNDVSNLLDLSSKAQLPTATGNTSNVAAAAAAVEQLSNIAIQPSNAIEFPRTNWQDPFSDWFDPQLGYDFTDQVDDAFRSWLASPILAAQSNDYNPEQYAQMARASGSSFESTQPWSGGVELFDSSAAANSLNALHQKANRPLFSAAALACRYVQAERLWPAINGGTAGESSFSKDSIQSVRAYMIVRNPPWTLTD
jgi:hypothetical protein